MEQWSAASQMVLHAEELKLMMPLLIELMHAHYMMPATSLSKLPNSFDCPTM